MPNLPRWIAPLLAGAIAWGSPLSSHGLEIPAIHYSDAQLNDVCLLDAHLAWVVGDRGTILHSADGGRTWQPQAVASERPIEHRLMSVHFVDAHTGWAVGGRTQPHTLGSSGIVLATGDGGRTWRELPTRNLPALARVKFFDVARGLAIGRASSMQPSGVFATEDGGRTWHAVSGGRGWSWQTGDFIDPLTGAVAGRGLWAGVDRRAVQTPSNEPRRLRAIRDLQLLRPVGGWAAGDGGLVLTTPDLGRTWFEPEGLLPGHAARHFDLQSVAVRGENVWAAGAPGSRVFHSFDAGRTWQDFPTGVPTPLTALAFSDQNHGVAVGALGTILFTDNGGQTWRRVRQGSDRTPLLAIAAREEAFPVLAIARSAAADGYLTSAGVLFRAALDDVTSSPSPQAVITRAGDDAENRIREATLLAGGTSANRAWRFPLPRDTGDLIGQLDRLTDGRGVAQLESYLVRQIRTWRPDVIVVGTSQEGPIEEDALARQALLRAVEAAADPTQHIELAAEMDLSAWRVKRVFAVATEANEKHLTVPTSSFVAHLGRTLGEVAADARAILAGAAARPEVVALEQLVPPGASPTHYRHMFDGIELAPGSGPRRAAPVLTDEQVETAAAAAEKRRNVQAILAGAPGNVALTSHVTEFSEGLSDTAQADLLYRMAEGYRSTGRRDLAAAALERLVREHPNDPLVDAALVWLVQYHAGSETRWEKVRGQKSEVRGQEIVAATEVDLRGGGGDRTTSEAEKALEVGRLAAEVRPQLVLEPQVGVPLAAAYRRAGLVKESDRYMLRLRQRGAADAWQLLADTERWLATPARNPPELPIWTCRRTTERPHLDGVLSEACWQSARGAVLASDDENSNPERRGELKLAFDVEFLYVAATIPVPQRGVELPSNGMPRERDADLRGRERVHLAIDVDRDLTTFYEFSIDARGHVHDQAWHDARWDPQWYIAHAAHARGWVIEAAIPLSELVADAPPRPRDVWCISGVHIAAGGGVTPWHGPARPEPSPASFGLLLFE